MKKRFLLFLLPILALTSCGSNTYKDTYTFMLGREGQKETQIGLQIELTEEKFDYKVYKPIIASVQTHADVEAYDTSSWVSSGSADKNSIRCLKDTDNLLHFYTYDAEHSTLANKLVDVGTQRPYLSIETIDENAKKFNASISLGQAGASMNEVLKKALDKGFSGYYIPTQYVDEKYGTRCAFGTIFNQDCIKGLEDIFDYLAKESTVELSDAVRRTLEEIAGSISYKELQYIVSTYLTEKKITIKIPVSLADLQLQLSWYGKFVDFDQSIFEGNKTLQEIINNLEKFLSSFRMYDLANHRTKITGKPLEEGELVNMPGIQGPERFGSIPSEVKGESGFSEVDYMNMYYANEFSNTFSYKKNGENYDKMGAITMWEQNLNQGTTDFYYYYDRDNVVKKTDPYVDTILLQKNLFGSYEKYQKVRIFLDHDLTDPNLGIKITSIKTLTASNDEGTDLVEYQSFYRDPFNFRAFHSLPLALSK